METAKVLQANLYQIADIARLAPSVHNTQPWKLVEKGNSLIISIDDTIELKYSDPTGRETYISLGIFTEAVIITAATFGLTVKKVSLSQAKVTVAFAKTSKSPLNDAEKLIGSLRTRCTDRSIFKPIQVTKTMASRIENSCKISGVKIKVVTDKNKLSQMADLTSKGISLALSNPDFRKELSSYLTLPFSNRKRGISVMSLRIPTVLALLEPKFIKHGIGLGAEVKTEKKRWQSASGIIFITTKGDVQWDWFCAGRAYLQTSLTAERLGLSQATSAATVEASTFHEDVEAMLGTQMRLQCVTRIGKGSPKKVFSPRESADVFLAT